MIYFVICHEENNLAQPLVSNSKEELFKKLNYSYSLTEDEFEELLVTKSLCKYMKFRETDITSTRINLFIDQTTG